MYVLAFVAVKERPFVFVVKCGRTGQMHPVFEEIAHQGIVIGLQ
jgi:hypothetical protein